MPYSFDSLPEDHSARDTAEFDAIQKRFRLALGCQNMFELAHVLGVTAASISDARRRLMIPDSWFRVAFLRALVNPAWLKSGAGARIVPLRGGVSQ